MYKDKDRQREYQRNWVRQKRAKGSTEVIPSDTLSVEPDDSLLQPSFLKQVESFTTADVIWESEPGAAAELSRAVVEPQSYNPMMVGYVPPKEQE